MLNTILDYENEMDVQKIGQIIEKNGRNYLLDLEQNAHILIKDCVVAHQLFDTDGEQLKERLNEVIKSINPNLRLCLGPRFSHSGPLPEV